MRSPHTWPATEMPLDELLELLEELDEDDELELVVRNVHK